MGPLQLIACAVVDGSATPAYFNQRGFTATISRAGAGNYTLTLNADNGIDKEESIVSTCLFTAITTSGSIAVVHTSDTAKQILITIDEAAADADFSIAFYRLPPET